MKPIKQLLTTIAVLLCSIMAHAYDFEVDGIYYNITSEKELTVEVTTSEGGYPNVEYNGTIEIPATVMYHQQEYNVTSIGRFAFYECSSLTSITIPNSVTSIGYSAFKGCSSLTSITIPNSVTYIGESAFNGCSSLTSITIPNSVTEIGYSAFYSCSSLTTIEIPNSVTSIGKWAFYSCSSLSSITIPNSVTSIGNATFEKCSSLDLVTIGNSVTSIGDSAFYNCWSLDSVVIGNSVTSIGNSAFYDCSSLTSITIPENVTKIGSRAFDDCTSITTIIWNAIFCDDVDHFPLDISGDNIVSLTFGENVIHIPSRFCCGMNKLTSITWNSIKCEDFDFSDTPFYYDNSQYIGDFDIRNKITSFTFGDNVKHIPACLCSGMDKLTYITIPESVTSIGKRAFESCTSLTSITIPNSVTSIGDRAFYWCESLTSITIEATTPPTLGESVFDNTPPAIYIPDNTLSVYQEAWGTDYNFVCNENSLTIHIETPGTLSDKIFEAWQRPANVAKLTLTGTLNNDDFTLMRETMTSLVEVDLSNITNTNGVNFTKKYNLMKIYLPENLSIIEKYAFYSCKRLTSITIPENVTSIGESAFSNCSSLSSITIPNSVTSIGKRAFESCSSLTSITIGNSVTSIGYNAFYNCDLLSAIHISDIAAWCNIDFDWYDSSPLHYAENLYLNGEKVTNLVIPESVTSIKNYTFYNCSSLSSITIPNSVTSIGESAFKGCSSLNTITCLNFNPPVANDLGANTKKCTLIVPKEAYAEYLKHEYWGQFLTIKPLDSNIYKKIDISVNDSSFGNINIANGYYCINDSITITATPNKGYHFTQWSDGNTENPRTIVITQDITFTAEFAQNPTYNVTLFADNGIVSGAGTYSEGDTITITATANKGYKFKEWSDGNTDNPRIIVVTEDIKLTAIFEKIDTSVENTFDNQISLYSIGGTLHIEGLESDYQIYTTTGQIIYSGKQTILTLPHGIYLIVINGKTHKIAL